MNTVSVKTRYGPNLHAPFIAVLGVNITPFVRDKLIAAGADLSHGSITISWKSSKFVVTEWNSL